MKSIFSLLIIAGSLLFSCGLVPAEKEATSVTVVDSSTAFAAKDTLMPEDSVAKDTLLPSKLSSTKIDTRKVNPSEVVAFAKTLVGVPYRYASIDPVVGFDCSGFITYVFHHFDIIVPRSSIDFTEVGNPVALEEAREGDIVLFTGTDSTEKFVGHMGLVVSNENGIVNFIHSTSGKQHGVTITPLADYYHSRYVKTIRIF